MGASVWGVGVSGHAGPASVAVIHTKTHTINIVESQHYYYNGVFLH